MSLDDFIDDPDDRDDEDDDGEPEEPPEMRRKQAISHPYKRHTIGNIVYVYNRGGGSNAYYSPRNRYGGERSERNPTGKQNYFEKYDSYPISLPVMGKIQYFGVERIFVLERETKTLYEFSLQAYLDGPTYVDRTGKKDDKQLCPSIDEALTVWRSVNAADLWA